MGERATLQVGDEAPDFELPSNPTGDKFKLSDHRGNPRGRHQLRACRVLASLQQPAAADKSRSARSSNRRTRSPVAISSDNTWTLKAWREQTGVNSPVLSDFNPIGDTASKYGVLIED